jgi:cardiolipin synthase
LVVRDHGKVVVKDQMEAWVASANIGDDYAVRWHDAGVVVKGQIVSELLRDFDEIWDGVAAGVIPARSSVVFPEPAQGTQRRLPMRVVANGFDGYATWPHIRAMLMAARRRILVSHCYLTEAKVIELLQDRARAGLTVVILAPDHSDVAIVDLLMHEDVRDLLAAGVRYYHFQGMSHRKSIIVDDRWVLLGSANLDGISLDVNLEVGLAIYSPTFGRLATARLVASDVRRAVRLREAPVHGWRRMVAWLVERFRDFL